MKDASGSKPSLFSVMVGLGYALGIAGLLIFAVIGTSTLVKACSGRAYGSEPPPLIGPVRGPASAGTYTPPYREPAPAPMCTMDPVWLLRHDPIPDPSPPTPDELWGLAIEPPDSVERADVERVIRGCRKGYDADPHEVLALLRLEQSLGVPRSFRLILAASVCVEVGWSPSYRTLQGDQGRALGPFQLHWPWAAYCIDTKTMRTPREWEAVMRTDPRGGLWFSARCWVAAINRQLPKARKVCAGRSELQVWELAEAIVSRPPHKPWCGERTAHSRLAAEWREEGLDTGATAARK